MVAIPMWLVCVLCTHWEPIVRDSWGHLHWHRHHEVTLSSIWEYAKGSYEHNNPRLGQLVSLLMFTPGWHPVVTPILEMALFWLLTAHVLGRIPRTTDLGAFVVVSAVVVWCAPVMGQMLFYRPFTGNYVFGFVLDLAILLPFRLHVAAAPGPSPRGPIWREALLALAMLVVAAMAGECNEHTGPAVGALMLAATIVRRRELRAWMFAAMLGLALGWIVLLLAPGQDIRYDGVAKQAGVLGRIWNRGIPMDLWLVVKPALYLLAALPWAIVAIVARVRSKPVVVSRPLLAYAAAGLLMAITLLGSPKEGERLYFASVVMGAIAISGWLLSQTDSTRARSWLVALSAIALLCWGGIALESSYTMGAESQERLDILEHAAPRSTVSIRRYSRDLSRWFVGEDLDDTARKRLVAKDFGVADIEVR